MNEFQNKKILITGASKGIGFALAKALDRAGARLLLHAVSDDGLKRLEEQFAYRQHYFWQSDFSRPETLENSIAAKLNELGTLDGYVNCVGMRIRRPLNLLNIRLIQEAFNTNFTSYIEILRLISKRNRYNIGMSILSISSVSAHAGAPGVSVYAATKGALESATRCLAQEFQKKRIRINTIVSGQVNTESYVTLMDSKEEKEDSVLQRQYMGLLEVEQLVQACLFLLSEKSSFINGTSFPADGGFLQ
jgi:NAD(P)-dependent dehydrogenase (short-subunit alcohol dehydrogenase family)